MNFDPHLSAWLEDRIYDCGYSVSTDGAILSAAILKMSDGFQKQVGRETPWSDKLLCAAYLSYFFPLNFLRIQRVLSLLPQNFMTEVEHIVEIGSGAGNFQKALPSQPKSYEVAEKSIEAYDLHCRLARDFKMVMPERKPSMAALQCRPRTLAVFCYSLNELSELPREVAKADFLLIIEPSQRELARNLMTRRQTLIAQGYFPVAPCTHFGECPLLAHSKTDFCHDRFFADLPDWLLQLETHLPMKNKTLTSSYLVMTKRRDLASFFGQTRILGDTLFEKGKIRQAICRGDKREFLSVLRKDVSKSFAGYPHGSLISLPADAELKGNEVRLKNCP